MFAKAPAVAALSHRRISLKEWSKSNQSFAEKFICTCRGVTIILRLYCHYFVFTHFFFYNLFVLSFFQIHTMKKETLREREIKRERERERRRLLNQISLTRASMPHQRVLVYHF